MTERTDPPAHPWPRERARPIPLADAQMIVKQQAERMLAIPRADRRACTLDRVLGHVLATAVCADRDHPAFNRATRDGYAVRAEDVSRGGTLRIAGRLRAGERSRVLLQPGEALEIMTGAPLPDGADSVLMVEHTEPAAQTKSAAVEEIRPTTGRLLRPGENVVLQGSEALRGSVLLTAGRRIRPAEIALAAACGLTSLEVYEEPSVAILATGDELMPPEGAAGRAPIPDHRIYDSNSRALAALVGQANAHPLLLPAAEDRPDALCRRIAEGLDAAPLLVITGGVSAGRYDLVQRALAELGVELLFAGVRIQPGKPVVFGRVPATDTRPERFVFGLPGNPVSAMVTFRLFAQPLLAALSGERDWQPTVALAILRGELLARPDLTRLVPGRLETNLLDSVAAPVASQGSGDLAANSRTNCLLISPEGGRDMRNGDAVRVLLC